MAHSNILPSKTKVLIVGAGPVGLTAACGLLMRGIEVAVVDVYDKPHEDSRAAVVHAATMEALEYLNIAEKIEQRGYRCDYLTFLKGRIFELKNHFPPFKNISFIFMEIFVLI